jgi:hypothetical protein
MRLLFIILMFTVTNVNGQVKRGDTLFIPETIKVLEFAKTKRTWIVDSNFIAQPKAPLKVRATFMVTLGGQRKRITLYTNGTYIETK